MNLIAQAAAAADVAEAEAVKAQAVAAAAPPAPLKAQALLQAGFSSGAAQRGLYKVQVG